MRDKQDIWERIKYETELLRLALLAATGATGGVVGLLLGEATVLRAGLAGLESGSILYRSLKTLPSSVVSHTFASGLFFCGLRRL